MVWRFVSKVIYLCVDDASAQIRQRLECEMVLKDHPEQLRLACAHVFKKVIPSDYPVVWDVFRMSFYGMLW